MKKLLIFLVVMLTICVATVYASRVPCPAYGVAADVTEIEGLCEDVMNDYWYNQCGPIICQGNHVECTGDHITWEQLDNPSRCKLTCYCHTLCDSNSGTCRAECLENEMDLEISQGCTTDQKCCGPTTTTTTMPFCSDIGGTCKEACDPNTEINLGEGYFDCFIDPPNYYCCVPKEGPEFSGSIAGIIAIIVVIAIAFLLIKKKK